MKKIVFLFSLVIMLTISTTASASLLTVGGGWYEFWYGGVGSSWTDDNPYPLISFEFTLTQTGLLTVTDAFLAGDRFSVNNYASLLGNTSVPTGGGSDNIVDDYDAAAADARWSTGIFQLAAGTYDISGTAIVSPYGGGRGALRVDNVVPEPMTLLLFGTGLVGFFVRKKA